MQKYHTNIVTTTLQYCNYRLVQVYRGISGLSIWLVDSERNKGASRPLIRSGVAGQARKQREHPGRRWHGADQDGGDCRR